MKVLGLMGSPRRNGNTSVLVNSILEGARQAGAETRAMHLVDHLKRGCLACFDCMDTGECAGKDVREIHGAMMNTDALVLGTPIYYGGVSSKVAQWRERLWAPMHNKHFRERWIEKGMPTVLAYTCSNEADFYEGYFAGAVGHLRFAGLLATEVVGIGRCATRSTNIRDYNEELREAVVIGKELVKSIVENQ
jgi:multimeric flavodoxin WrbA